MIVVVNAVFNSFSYITAASAPTYRCFPGILLTSTPHNILSNPLAAFPHNHCRNTDSGERGMNLVAMTIYNPRKEYWPSRGSNQRPPFLKSSTLPTELWGSARKMSLSNWSLAEKFISKLALNLAIIVICFLFGCI